jgi:hypothetical protein
MRLGGEKRVGKKRKKKGPCPHAAPNDPAPSPSAENYLRDRTQRHLLYFRGTVPSGGGGDGGYMSCWMATGGNDERDYEEWLPAGARKTNTKDRRGDRQTQPHYGNRAVRK